MQGTGNAARVGLAVLAAAGVLILATFGLRGTTTRWGTYKQKVAFADAQGLQEGGYVRVLGVDKGMVDKVDLGSDRQAIATLRIDKDYPIHSDDLVRIVTSPVGFTPPYVEITPHGNRTISGAAPLPEMIQGQSGTSAERLMSEGEQLLHNLNALSIQLTDVTSGFAKFAQNPALQRNLVRSASNFEKISTSGVVIARNMEGATAKADRLINSFQGTAASLNHTLQRADALIGGFQGFSRQAQSTMTDTRALVRDTRGMIRDTNDVVRGAKDLVQNTNTTVQNAGGLVNDTRTLLSENRERFRDVLESLNTSLKQLDGTLAETRTLIADPNLRSDFKQTAANVRDATENLKKISQDVEGLTGDPKVQEDLKASIAGLRDATEQAADTLRAVRNVLGGGGKTAKSIGQRVSDAQLDAELVRETRADRTRLDFNATIPWSARTFYRVGFYDFGESNKFNAQMGQKLRNSIWTRYGVYASTLGVGLDLGSREQRPFSLDLYGVDRPTMDVRGRVPLTSFLDLDVGIDNLLRRPDPVVGLRYRK